MFVNLKNQNVKGYLFQSLLGKGTFGEVWKVSKDSKDYAIKIIENKNSKDAEMEKKVANNIPLSSPFLVKYFNTFNHQNALFVVMEYCSHGNLEELIQKSKGNLSENRLMKIIIQLLLSLGELHKHHIVHRDIKAANAFINYQDDIKLGDFGCGTILDNRKVAGTFVGTFDYMAPEITHNVPYSFPADVFSLGVLFYLLITLKLPSSPFFSIPENERRKMIDHIPDFVCPFTIRTMITSMIMDYPQNRPTIHQLLFHPHVQKFSVSLGLKKFFPITSPATFYPFQLQSQSPPFSHMQTHQRPASPGKFLSQSHQQFPSQFQGPQKSKTVCRYDPNCTRKNPDHFTEYSQDRKSVV